MHWLYMYDSEMFLLELLSYERSFRVTFVDLNFNIILQHLSRRLENTFCFTIIVDLQLLII